MAGEESRRERDFGSESSRRGAPPPYVGGYGN
jgi:hypothetical protein